MTADKSDRFLDLQFPFWQHWGMAIPKATPEIHILRRVAVRLLRPEERPRFDQLLEQKHDLHSARLGGQSLRYVAELDGPWGSP